MHKVIVERPRWTPGPDKFARRANLSDELLPRFEGIKRMHGKRKGQRDLLGPLRRWLHAQVGRQWNLVYGEACAVSHPDNYVRAHVKTHVIQFVERNAFVHDGKVCVLDTDFRGRGIIPVTERRYGRNLFYVHPETGVLCEIPHRARERWRNKDAERRALTQRWLNTTTLLRQLKGYWFECRMEPFPRRTPKGDSPWLFDVAERKLICRSNAGEIYGCDVFCVAKRQLSRRELKEFDLVNRSTILSKLFLNFLKIVLRLISEVSCFGSLKINPQPWRPYGKSSIRSGPPVFSRSPANVAKVSHPRRKSNADSASCTGIRNFRRSSVAMTLAPAVQDAAFKNCCLRSGRYDGVRRNYYFRE